MRELFKKIFQMRNIKHVIWIIVYVLIFICISSTNDLEGLGGIMLTAVFIVGVIDHLLAIVGIVSTPIFNANKEYKDDWKLSICTRDRLGYCGIFDVLYIFGRTPSSKCLKEILVKDQGLYLAEDKLSDIVTSIQAGRKYVGVDNNDNRFVVRLEKIQPPTQSNGEYL